MNLFGSIDITSLENSKYILLLLMTTVDISTWTYFLIHKNNCFKYFTKFYKQIKKKIFYDFFYL